MPIIPKQFMTPEDYLAFERQSEIKHEYYGGDLFVMAGASEQHNNIVANVLASFVVQMKGRPCKAYSSDLRINVTPTGLYTYPDVVVVCGKPRFHDAFRDTITNPAVIVEVLSESTEAYDRGQKFQHYQTIESLSDYLLVTQTVSRIEHFARRPDGHWLYSEHRGLDAEVVIDSIQCKLPLVDVYDKVEWPDAMARSGAIRVVKESSEPWVLAGMESP